MNLSELRGVGVALVTPFRQDGNIDYPALEKLIEHVIAGGVQTLLSLGTTGEVPTLSDDEKKEVILFTIEKAKGRVPVIVGVGGNNTREVVHQLNTFPLEKAAAVLSVCPYYNRPSDEGLYQHYKAVAEASPKPVILYNVPARTGKKISTAVILRLANDFKNIIAIKDATGDIGHCMELIKEKPEGFTVVSGDDMLTLPQIACGEVGIISVAANYFAKEMSRMVHHALSQDYEEARKIHYELLPAFHYMFAENNPAGVKSFLAAAGLIEENLRLPDVPVSSGLRKKIADFVKIGE